MPYDWQHRYWWIIGPPLLLPVYFHYENLRSYTANPQYVLCISAE